MAKVCHLMTSDFFAEGDAEQSDREDEMESVNGESKASTAGCNGMPVVWPESCQTSNAGPVCFLCSCKATDKSPLASSFSTDAFGGAVPWQAYKKVRDDTGDVIGKTPWGKSCRICRNVWNAIGFQVTYGSFKDYKATMAKKEGPEIHKKFLASRKEWLKEHNRDPRKTRLKDKSQLKEIQRSLEVKKRRGGQFTRPKKVFVAEGNWDDKLDGIKDDANLTTEHLFGKDVKGIWKSVGREGHYDFEEYDDTVVEENNVEEQGSGVFIQDAIKAKSELLLGSVSAISKERDAIAVQAPTLTFADIASMVGFAPAASELVTDVAEPESNASPVR